MRDDANIYRPLAVSVPGQMAAMDMLWEKWGRLPWKNVAAPSHHLLEQGFPYGQGLMDYMRLLEGELSVATRLLSGI